LPIKGKRKHGKLEKREKHDFYTDYFTGIVVRNNIIYYFIKYIVVE
jgi:hypothetical protein